MKTQLVIGDRPTEAPEGWIVCSASRPLAGEIYFYADGPRGIHHTAFPSSHPQIDYILQANESLGAYILRYVTRQEALIEARETIIKIDGVTQEECNLTDTSLLDWYFQHLWEIEHN